VLTWIIENSLKTYDLAVPLPYSNHIYRLLILTEADCDDETILLRLDHFYSLSGGSHCSILFLANATSTISKSQQCFQQIHYLVMTNAIDLTIHYVPDVASLPQIVKACVTLPAREEVRAVAEPNALTQVLPFCSIASPMSQQALIVLTDIAPSMRGLSALQSNDFIVERMVQSGVSVQEAEACVEFWRDEYLPE